MSGDGAEEFGSGHGDMYYLLFIVYIYLYHLAKLGTKKTGETITLD